jgi:hypothetical protein
MATMVAIVLQARTGVATENTGWGSPLFYILPTRSLPHEQHYKTLIFPTHFKNAQRNDLDCCNRKNIIPKC